ncbi:hypothetical protein PP175_28690 (plasmid) [Aneurinibacillus sp. Ricciae_BoGa-3]|uniref:hypothetical protein n=1 Tax=Aneurinibacillus sp. Ricciae_BoGa-3 TaxID=3022697 RepID=UPI00233FC805|nr:hypothetical protein [Aneurinibacillus sp. Ricciae_BoGa-3]WCK57168.1 hypothetical protein PP175_28690 [Aneurinibacillus sp. Ricciae_BoGa-3]
MEYKYQIGDRVIAINKTPRIRERDNCATYYQQLERKQDFLYVVGYDEEETERLGVPCYWCNVVPAIGGDSFSEKDLVFYQEKAVM